MWHIFVFKNEPLCCEKHLIFQFCHLGFLCEFPAVQLYPVFVFFHHQIVNSSLFINFLHIPGLHSHFPPWRCLCFCWLLLFVFIIIVKVVEISIFSLDLISFFTFFPGIIQFYQFVALFMPMLCHSIWVLPYFSFSFRQV